MAEQQQRRLSRETLRRALESIRHESGQSSVENPSSRANDRGGPNSSGNEASAEKNTATSKNVESSDTPDLATIRSAPDTNGPPTPTTPEWWSGEWSGPPHDADTISRRSSATSNQSRATDSDMSMDASYRELENAVLEARERRTREMGERRESRPDDGDGGEGARGEKRERDADDEGEKRAAKRRRSV